jgi:hypothetical protein
MFKFFRKLNAKADTVRTSQPKILADDELLRIMRETFIAHDETVAALFLVAYENLPVYSNLFMQVEKVEPQYGASLRGLADFLDASKLSCSSTSLPDEVNSRRFFYMHLATQLKILEIQAKKKPELWNDIAALWVELLPGARALRRTIDCTSLWAKEETEYFQDVGTEDEGENYCVRFMMPEEVRYHTQVIDWQERDLSPETIAELRAMEKLFRGD